jgi:SAM-dependent methyltransferase
VTEFRTRDCGLPAFWDERFEAGVTPWDAGGVPRALLRFLAGGRIAPGARVLIPGCGSAWEAGALDDAGLAVQAIDFSPAAIARARTQLGARADRLLRQADFFEFDAPAFDWIYERTFLPALPPARWPDWAARVAALAAPDALLAGFFFQDPAVTPANRRGPPFALAPGEIDVLLAPHFDPLERLPVPAAESVPVLAGRELWCTWRRR